MDPGLLENGVGQDATEGVGSGDPGGAALPTMKTEPALRAEIGCEVSPCRSLVGAACHLLGQCGALVRGLSDGQFVAPSARLGGGTIGQHLRHVVDHFRAIVLRGGVIDYDHRDRHVPMETSRGEALRVIEAMHEHLHSLGAGSDATAVSVRVMISGDGTEVQLGSTLGRELAFATHHAVHHQAMIRSIALELGAVVDSQFGRAPSTIHFERRRPG